MTMVVMQNNCKVSKSFRIVVSIAGGVGAILIFFMVLLLTVDVAGRYVFGASTIVATELSGYALVAIIFLGLSYTQRAGQHIRITLLTGRLSQKRRHQLEIATLILTAVFFIWFTWVTADPVIYSYMNGVVSLTIMRVPMWIPQLFIPLGTSIFVAELVVEIIGKLRS